MRCLYSLCTILLCAFTPISNAHSWPAPAALLKELRRYRIKVQQLHGVPAHLHWLLIYPHERGKENYLGRVEEMHHRGLLCELRAGGG